MATQPVASSPVITPCAWARSRTMSKRPMPRTRDDLDAGRWEPTCPICSRALVAVAIDETAPLEPRNVYAATKLHQEHLSAAYGREHDATVVALRYHNVYGPRMPRDTPYAQ